MTIRIRSAPVAMAVLLNLTVACSAPLHEGAQVQLPLAGFSYDASSVQERSVFPDREILSQGAWWNVDAPNNRHSSLFLTAYPGGVTEEEARAARDAQEERYGRPGAHVYGALARGEIDRRPAWSWVETRYGRDGQVAALEYKAVVSYDTVTHVVEFFSDQPDWLDTVLMSEVVRSFGVGRPRVRWDFIILGVVVLAALMIAGRRRMVRVTSRADFELVEVAQEGGEE